MREYECAIRRDSQGGPTINIPTEEEIQGRIDIRLRIAKEHVLKEIAREMIVEAIEDALGIVSPKWLDGGDWFRGKNADPFGDPEDAVDCPWLRNPCWDWLKPSNVVDLSADGIQAHMAQCIYASPNDASVVGVFDLIPHLTVLFSGLNPDRVDNPLQGTKPLQIDAYQRLFQEEPNVS